MNLYPLAKALVSAVLYPFYRIKVIGKENFPKDGGVLLCANHIANIDPPVVGITSPRPVNFMAKEELFEMPVLKSLLPSLNAYPVKRGMSDRKAFRKTIEVLKSGNVVGMFPEGTRSKDGKLQEGLSGVGFFALKGNAVVMPCAIIGPYKPFTRLTVVYGKPMDLTTERAEKVSAEDVTKRIMKEIQVLLDAHKK